MLSGIHFLLTYTCTYACDHCFLYCSPQAEGTFTIAQIRAVLDQAVELGSVKSTYFEGGEAFLYYPVLVKSVELARERGMSTGLVTNCYWATSEEDAALWLEPLARLRLDDFTVSDDAFHGDTGEDTPPRRALAAAAKLGMKAGTICLEEVAPPQDEDHRGQPVAGNSPRYLGRAAEKLIEGKPGRPAIEFTSCPYEELEHPQRVHLDAYGNVHICQGISMGNMWETPLAELVRSYRAADHPICRPLLAGGPLELAEKYGIEHGGEYVDACHLCYQTRLALLERFPAVLSPRQVYGKE